MYKPRDHPKLGDKKWLREQYRAKERSMRDIANEIGCNHNTVDYALDQHDIVAREREESIYISNTRPDELEDGEWLKEKYLNEELSTRDIASLLDVSPGQVRNSIIRAEIEFRSRSKATEVAVPSGEDHHQYGGGDIKYGPGWNRGKRKTVRERDNRQCRLCGQSGASHIAEWNEKLHVHHIVKAKAFDDPKKRNALENLIALCRSCHRDVERFSPLLPPGVKQSGGVADV